MKKILFLYLCSIFLFYSNSKLIEIKVQLDSESNRIIFDGHVYKISNESIPDSDTNRKTITNSEEEKSDSFFDGFWFNFVGFSILACFAGACHEWFNSGLFIY